MIVTGIESLGDGRVFVKVSDPLPRIAQGWQLVCGASVWVVEAVDGCRGMRPRIVTGLQLARVEGDALKVGDVLEQLQLSAFTLKGPFQA